MSAYLAAAGPLVWPVLVLALATVVLSAQYLRSGRLAFVPAALGVGACTVLLALLSVVVGYQLSVGALVGVEPDSRWIYLLGIAESLNALVLALAACALSALLLSAGGFRSLRGAAAG